MNPKVDDLVQYPDWTGLKTKQSRVVRISSYQGHVYYILSNGDQLDQTSFDEEGATVIS